MGGGGVKKVFTLVEGGFKKFWGLAKGGSKKFDDKNFQLPSPPHQSIYEHSLTGVLELISTAPVRKTSKFARGGHSTLGYAPCATKKTLLFFRSLSPKDPIFTNFHPMTPCFSKILTFLTKCWEIFGHFGPESPQVIFDAFHWKTPYFSALCHSKTPFFDAICHRKTPTSEVLGGTRTSLSYVSAPLPLENLSTNLSPVRICPRCCNHKWKLIIIIWR